MRKLIFILIALISFSQAQTIQYIGAPTTTVISRGNFRADSIFYLPKRTKTPTDTAAFRYQISDSSLYYWTGYQWTKVQSASSFASVDTNIISTRAWRQKGIDSVQYNVGLKVNISDTASMLSPYIVGSGTSNYFPKFNSTKSVINSKLYESNLNLLFNSTTPYLTTSGISTIENNGTSAALYVLKTLDTARAYVSFGGANTMDINNLRAGDIRFYTNATLRGRFQTDGTFRLNSLTGTGSRIVVADDNGVLSATSSATGLVDTTLLSTRAYRQKGDDSLGAIIATKGSGTVTSVATGYGLSGGTITTTGTLIADTLNLSTRAWRQKGLDSLAALEISGSGTTNYVPKFTNTRELGNSQIFDNGTNVGIGTVSPSASVKLDINGITNFRGDLYLGTPSSINSRAYYFNATNTGRGEIYYDGSNNNFRIESTYGGSGTSQPITFWTGFNERLRLTSSGELLINTTTDAGAYTLQNNGALYNTGSAILAATSGNVGIGTTSPNERITIQSGSSVSAGITFRGNNLTSSDELFIGQGTTGNTFIYNRGAYPMSFGVSGATQMHITSTGDVGIGTTSPAVKLQVIGNVRGTRLNSTGGVVDFDAQSGSNFIQVTGGVMNFANAGAVNASINAAGEFLFGTTTDAGNYRVQVSGNAYVTGETALGVTSGNVQFGSTLNAWGSQYKVIQNQRTSFFSAAGYGWSGIAFNLYNDNTNYKYSSTNFGGEYRFDVIDGSHNFLTAVSGTADNNATVTNRFRIGNEGIVSVNTTSPNASAQLDVSSTTRGFLPPRMTTTQRDLISSPAAGLVIYNTTTSKLQVYTTSWTDLH